MSIEKCNSHSSSKKPPFRAVGDYYRDSPLVKCRKQVEENWGAQP